MFTKECKLDKYCCFYVSDFHLEMILLPYIKSKINEKKVHIFTEYNLLESLKILLDKINFTEDDKNKILELNWCINEKQDVLDDCIIIINGNTDYIEKIEKKLKNLKNAKIIHCYNISKNNLKIAEIKKNYKGILNTGTILNI